MAVKVFEPAETIAQERMVVREIRTLDSCRHPKLLTFFGLMLKPYATVCELALMSVYQYAYQTRAAGRPVDVFQILWDVAQGMEFLHSRNIVHRDLKMENCLVTALPCGERPVEVKVADYGMARLIDHAAQSLSTRVGTELANAPELASGQYKLDVDVFSFGRLGADLRATSWVADLCASCRRDSAQRPAFRDICAEFAGRAPGADRQLSAARAGRWPAIFAQPASAHASIGESMGEGTGALQLNVGAQDLSRWYVPPPVSSQ